VGGGAVSLALVALSDAVAVRQSRGRQEVGIEA
jgi:hypothetical protein